MRLGGTPAFGVVPSPNRRILHSPRCAGWKARTQEAFARRASASSNFRVDHVACAVISPAEWSDSNVSLAQVSTRASERNQGAQTATRQALARRFQAQEAGSQGTRAGAPHCSDGASSQSRSEPPSSE